MPPKIRPRPGFLDNMKKHRVEGGKQIWVSQDGDLYYTWDSLHGEIEVFNIRGRHLGVLDPVDGTKIKNAVKGRKINV